jgi:hypothetical protein
MTPILNPQFLRQTQFDSAAPAGAAMVVHRFERDGEFQLSVARRDEILQRARVNVGRGTESGGAGGGLAEGRDPLAAERPSPEQPDVSPLRAVALDMATLLRAGTQPPELDDLPSSGYLSITSSEPLPEHHLVVSAGETAEDILDTRRLGPRSIFAVTLIRPGRYRLRNVVTESEATVVVTYPTVGKTPYRPPAPLEIQSTAEGFGASTFTISPAQGIVFRFATESRIQLELVEPDDGPNADQRRSKASLRRPPQPGAETR